MSQNPPKKIIPMTFVVSEKDSIQLFDSQLLGFLPCVFLSILFLLLEI